MENKTVTPEIGLDVALKITKQAQTSIANTQKKEALLFSITYTKALLEFPQLLQLLHLLQKLFRLLTKRQNDKIRHRTPNTVANAETNI